MTTTLTLPTPILRVIAEDNKFSIQVMYIEESNLTDPNDDIALLDLMIDRNNLDGAEYWEPDTKAIRKYAESFKEMITINVCQN